jgi:hypothetical protein
VNGQLCRFKMLLPRRGAGPGAEPVFCSVLAPQQSRDYRPVVTTPQVWLAAVAVQVCVATYFLVGWEGLGQLAAVGWLIALMVQGVTAWRLMREDRRG